MAGTTSSTLMVLASILTTTHNSTNHMTRAVMIPMEPQVIEKMPTMANPRILDHRLFTLTITNQRATIMIKQPSHEPPLGGAY